jgi:hypothetical protein
MACPLRLHGPSFEPLSAWLYSSSVYFVFDISSLNEHCSNKTFFGGHNILGVHILMFLEWGIPYPHI